MRLLALVALAAMTALPVRAADGPSFECRAAAAPIEHLICNDHELARLDRRLAEVFADRRGRLDPAARKALLQEQRDWLAGRLSRCGIPAKGGAPEPPQAWRWAPCLADLSRARLRDLGAAEPAPVTPIEADFIHPLCLYQAKDGVKLDVTACNAGHRHVPVVDQGRADGFAEWYDFTVTTSVIGRWQTGAAVRLSYDDAIDGAFHHWSDILLLRRSGNTVTIAQRIDAGGANRLEDRLAGDEVTAVRLAGDGVLEVERRVTPYGVAHFGGIAAKEYEELCNWQDCAIGTLRQRYAGGRQTVLSLTVGVRDDQGNYRLPDIEQVLPRSLTAEEDCLTGLLVPDEKTPLPREIGGKDYVELLKAYGECVKSGE
jgi:uncharacterized protein YecT (DUF1311 family)